MDESNHLSAGAPIPIGIIETMKQATMQPTDELGQFIRDQQPPVVLLRPSPACMHNPLRSSDAGNPPSNSGGTYDDDCLQHTPVHWNYGHARSGTAGYLDRTDARDCDNVHLIPADDKVDHSTEKLSPSEPTVFTHINRGRPDQSVLYLGPDPLWDEPIQMPEAIPKWLRRKDIGTADDGLINPVSMTPEEFERQHGPHPGHVVTWHPKREPPPARPPLTLWQRLLPWTRPKPIDGEKWARKQLD